MKNILRRFLSNFPTGKYGDYVYSMIKFYVAHSRLPSKPNVLFNDYLFKLKVSDEIEDVMRQVSSDKGMVKSFAQTIIADARFPKTLGFLESRDQIASFTAGQPCVIKPAHSNGDVIYLDTGDKIVGENLAKASRALTRDIYRETRQRNYKNLRRRLICEEMLPDGPDIIDYKVFCFEGLAKLIQVDLSRHSAHRRNIYSPTWELLDITYNFPRGNPVPRPSCLPEMLSWAEKISQLFEFVRVDFFVSEGQLYLGEVTHCPEAAHGRFGSLEEERHFSRILFGKA
ncbi:hypothetical protein MKP08_11805 [Erythrobacter sp. LQ02-29]|uniref:ATP-grasp fold amidoligase family protein n=1 Tax=Erythrobacter sp. LQ02-29 TaxID=2920384 RepID=UPI001F4E3E07|nr:ATP-grasp fold amidoligase family protein [Erythrobacter sp. LQ02-29]MCP9223432.1 hypothetical protein [Erythrobacter sp. LQ02-29]